MKILVIFTGGTIGSSIKKGWADVDQSTQYTLLQNFQNVPGISFETCSPFSVLSENLSATELNLLQKELQEHMSQDFDGIIVTHGTDTLQYTAAAIEYAFCGCKMPIVFVSADYPLEDPKTNGFANFEAAVELIRSAKSGGVFVAYKNNDEATVNMHIGSRLLQHGEYNANVYSLDGAATNMPGIGPVEYVANPGILSIESYPGNDYSYDLSTVKAIVLKPYHSGTLDTANMRFREFCHRASEQNIPVFVTNTNSDVSYKSTALYTQLGILPIPYSTYISAYMKIWAAISLGKNIPEFVNTPISNEYLQ